jgi:hypothetical protein
MIKEAGRQNNLKIGDFFIAAGDPKKRTMTVPL